MLIDAYLYSLNVNNIIITIKRKIPLNGMLFRFTKEVWFTSGKNKGFINFLPDKVNETL